MKIPIAQLAVFASALAWCSPLAASPGYRVHLLAKAEVPVVCVFGAADDVVPPAENALLMEKRYNAALPDGATPMKMFPKPGVGHHPHGLKDPAPLVEFVKQAEQRFLL